MKMHLWKGALEVCDMMGPVCDLEIISLFASSENLYFVVDVSIRKSNVTLDSEELFASTSI